MELVGETDGSRRAACTEEFSVASFLPIPAHAGSGRGPGSEEAVPGTKQAQQDDMKTAQLGFFLAFINFFFFWSPC